MPAVTLNGTVFNGTMLDARNNSGSVRIAPQKISRTFVKAGTTLVAPNGVRTLMQRSVKSMWTLEWEKTTDLTIGGVNAVAALGAPFTAVIYGASLTVQCEDGDYEERLDFSLPSGTRYFSLKLVLHEV